MIETVAHVPTRNAARYVAQLCKYWSHKLAVDVRDDCGGGKVGDAAATLEPDTKSWPSPFSPMISPPPSASKAWLPHTSTALPSVERRWPFNGRCAAEHA